MKRLKVIIGPSTIDRLPKVVSPIPIRDDALYVAKREITHLKYEVERLQDKIRRMREDLEYEIAGWRDALESGHRTESYESIKRRISRLQGAIDFLGVIDFEKAEKG